MRKLIVMGIALAVAAAGACSSAGGTKKPGSSSDGDADADADTDADADADSDTDTETEPVSEGEWCDEETELCWQNPAENVEMCWYHAAGEPHITLNPDGVIDYCGELVWAGHSDWRLPEIDELIGLIRGCYWGNVTGDETASDCGVSDPECLELDCKNTVMCRSCSPSYLEGPDDAPPGCFWEPALEGPCPGQEPPLLPFSSVYWSASLCTGCDYFYIWTVYFAAAAVAEQRPDSEKMVRCVRDGSGGPDDPD